MRKITKLLSIIVLTLFFFTGCARTPPTPVPAPATGQSAYVAPQSAPVLPPTYPSLGGPVIQMDTASIPLVQGK